MGSTRLKALNCYKRLLRARRTVFQGDDFAIKESRAAIREAFEKNKHMTDENEILKSVEMGRMAEQILLKDVMQAKLVPNNTVRLNVRLDNVKDSKSMRVFRDSDD